MLLPEANSPQHRCMYWCKCHHLICTTPDLLSAFRQIFFSMTLDSYSIRVYWMMMEEYCTAWNGIYLRNIVVSWWTAFLNTILIMLWWPLTVFYTPERASLCVFAAERLLTITVESVPQNMLVGSFFDSFPWPCSKPFTWILIQFIFIKMTIIRSMWLTGNQFRAHFAQSQLG